ncbi:peptidase M28 [Phormidesmis priestleyi ULC007]|uniref:Peptidase M28 n=1 Tax=Phormidesmis priestleyi ULC007 TaxID=1920490 RepID=A0A2T1DLI9_9CYAN|nr:peptidase M28 [Phormidesmis priestleyi ULC007]PZO50696.1 MAG: peptidase M28 [Phormidesmis priestleyi]
MALKERLRSHLQEIIRERDAYLATEGHFYVQQYIRQEFSQWGIAESHEFLVGAKTHSNWVLNLPAQDQVNRSEILIGAHYDTVPGSPGADDNATGISVLLEMARAFHAEPARHPIRLVAFDFEETSYDRAGSTHYAHSLKEQPLRLMISLEMLGYCVSDPNSQNYPIGLKYFYPNQGDFIGLIGNLKSIPDLIHLRRNIRQAGVGCEWLPVPNKGKILPLTRRSDHAPFWDRGDRALMITDTADLRNPNYHKASDRLETLDLDFLTGICHGLITGIRSL